MRVGVLGPLEVDGGAVSLGPRDRAALQVLVLRLGSPVRPDTIAEALWGDDAPASAGKVVQGCVVRLRKALGPTTIETTEAGYRLRLHHDEVDASQFEELLDRARTLLADGQPDRAQYVLDRATELWRGEPFVDLTDWEPARIEAERLVEQRRDAEELAAEVALALGRHEDVTSRLGAMVREQPTREQRWGMLALAQYRCGRQAEALATLQQARTRLVTDLGLDPGPALGAMEAAVLRQDPSLDPPEPVGDPGGECPYPGLPAYEAHDAAAFFGRDADIGACLRRLDEAGVLAVVGPSGCGKSSLLRAGVAAALLGDGHDVIVITPGPEPLAALEGVRLGARAAVVVDQCEEAFAAPPDQVRQFLGRLAEHHRRGGLLALALRADRVGDLSAHTHMARLVEDGLHLLGPLSVEGLRQAVEGPAAQSGLRLEDGLVELLVRDVEGEPGALPLLSHVLRRTWELREGRTLTVGAYRSTGGVRGALAQSAEGLFRDLDAGDQARLHELMTRLVTLGDHGAPVRQRVSRRAVDRDRRHQDLVERLVTARLLSADGDSVEIAHESLAVAWPRLRSWLDDDVDGQRIMRHLSLAAESWEGQHRPESELYRGARQVRSAEWARRAHPELTEAEQDFLAESAALAEREQRATEDQVRRERRVNRRLRAGLVATVVLALVATTSGVLASVASRRAHAAAVAADARRLGAEALRSKDLDTALLLSVAGVRLDESSDTRANLLASLDRAPNLVRLKRTPRVVSLALNTRSGLVLAQAPEEALLVRRADTLAPVAVHPELRGAAVFVAPDGSAAVVTPMPDLVSNGVPAVVVLDPAGGVADEQLGGIPPGRHAQQNASIGPDSRWLAVTLRVLDGDLPPVVGVWDLSNRRRPVAVLDLGDQRAYPVVTPGGHSLWTSGGGVLRETELPSGRELRTVKPADLDVGVLDGPFALSPDGSTLAVAAGAQLALVDAARGTVRHVVPLVGGADRISFSGDGRRVAAAGGTLMVWDISGEVPVELLVQENGGGWPAFDGSGSTLYTAAFDGMLLAWDLSGERGFLPSVVGASALGVGGGVVKFAPDGRRVLRASGGPQWRFSIRDVDAGAETRAIDVGQDSTAWIDGAWSPDGRLVTVQTGDDVVTVWDSTTLAEVARRALPAGEQVPYAEFADQGTLLAGTTKGRIHVLDARTLEPRREPIAVAPARVDSPPGILSSLLSRPGTGQVLASAEGGGLWLVDTRSGTVRDVDLGVDVFGAAWSPDGERLAVTTRGGAVGLRDVDGERWIAPLTDRQPFAGWAPAFAADGSEWAVSASDRVGRWDGLTGAFLGAVSTDTAALAYAPDLSALHMARDDGLVRRWDLDPAAWVRTACAMAGRDLTEAEWHDHVPDREFRAVCTEATG